MSEMTNGFQAQQEKLDPLQRAKDAVNRTPPTLPGGTIDSAQQTAAQRPIAFALIALVEELRQARPAE